MESMRNYQPFAAFGIMRKDLLLISRDRSALIFLFGLPLVFAFLFGTAFGKAGGRNSNRSPVVVLVANEDVGQQGEALLAAMRKLGIGVEMAKEGSLEVARRVRTGDRAIGVVVPPDFSAQMGRTVDAMTSNSTNGTVPQTHIRLLMDPAQQQLAGLAQGAISGAAQRLVAMQTRQRFQERFGNLFPAGMRADSQNEHPPVVLDVVRAADAAEQSAVADSKEGSKEASKEASKESPGDMVIPGLAVYFVFFTASGVAATLITERQEGTLRRMLSAPVTPNQILGGKMLARGLLGMIQIALLFTAGKILIGFNLGSSIPGLVLTAVSTVFAATGLGLLIASFGKTLDQIQGMTTFALLIMGLISGSLFPRVLLPETIQKLSVITPHAWALNAYQDLLLRHLPLTATLGNIAMVVLFGTLFYSFALARFRYE